MKYGSMNHTQYLQKMEYKYLDVKDNGTVVVKGSNWKLTPDKGEDSSIRYTLRWATSHAPAQLWEMRKVLTLLMGVDTRYVSIEEAQQINLVTDDLEWTIELLEKSAVKRIHILSDENLRLTNQLSAANQTVEKLLKNKEGLELALGILIGLSMLLIIAIKLL
jgi:hypothetical protein